MTRSPASSSSAPARRPPIAWAVPTGTHRHNSSEISSQGRASKAPGKVKPTYPLGVTWTAIDEALPQHIVESLRLGLPLLGKKLRGYDRPDAVLTGVETRSSSPVTVTRDRTCHAVSTPGLYPCGEGAGYAGGIMSAATDGIPLCRSPDRGPLTHEFQRAKDTGPELHRELGACSLFLKPCTLAFSARCERGTLAGLRA